MFIPAATALKNLVYRIIPTPGQAFHGSVTLTTFFSIFPPYIPPLPFFFSLSPHVVLSGEQRKVFRGTDFDFWSFYVWEGAGADERCHGAPPPPPAVTCGCCDDVFPPTGRSPILCIFATKRRRAGGTAATALLWEMTLPGSNSFGLAPVGKPRASWRATAAMWDSPAEWPSGQTRMNRGLSHPTTQWEAQRFDLISVW